MEAFFGITYVVGLIVAIFVIRARSGLGVWGRIDPFSGGVQGFIWFVTAVFASMGWPVTLAIWLARGRPEPRVVFNDKAEERRRAMQH